MALDHWHIDELLTWDRIIRIAMFTDINEMFIWQELY